ncbi:MAG: acyltransferase [Lachnospiraceae bacterium]|nr:acyltransferase [Lachnospiraceae bacterium]
MESFYSRKELEQIGFKALGNENVLISRKASIYGAENMTIGSNVRVDDFCILSGKIELGNHIHIAAYSALYGGELGIYISDYANLSSRICIYSVSDDYSGETMTNPMIPAEYKNVDSRPVYIGKHVIIGSTSVVLPGVKLAEGSAFGCFSFINHDSEPWSVNVGIPFRKIKARTKTILDLEKKLIEEEQFR